jgi:hypothetical protein
MPDSQTKTHFTDFLPASLIVLILGLAAFPLLSRANDGAFRAEGNQLIPMYETDISVKKEILIIRRINETQARIEVYYEFFNPKEPKTLEVGFEAYSPSGDAEKTPLEGKQPYITGFTVTMNDESVPYKVAIVHDSLYYRNGQYKALSVARAIKESREDEEVDFFYVYHFRSLFKHGLNIIRHVYTVDLSSSVIENYSLSYVLTAAKRWANRQIDDFTLEIDMGAFQDISIPNTFFQNCSEWKADSAVKSIQLKANGNDQTDTSEFVVRKGTIIYSKKDFKPKGELYINSFNNYYYRNPDADNNDDKFNSKKDRLPFSIDLQDGIQAPADELSKKILRNLPFARRGYLFKSPELAAYYEHQKWYVPDPAYIPVASELTKKEQAWLKK